MVDVYRLPVIFELAVIMSTYCIFVLSWLQRCLKQLKVILHQDLLINERSFAAGLKAALRSLKQPLLPPLLSDC